MSVISCDACNNLREYAPNFVQNGTNEEVCTSLMNNTGLNPGLTVLHDNCEDLHDVNDCLIGRMTDELEAYDVCDWKDFMKKHNSNLYELLKAIICSDCGLWVQLCTGLDTILALMRGDRPTGRRGYWNQEAYAKFTTEAPFIKDQYFWEMPADIMRGGACDSTKSLGRYTRPVLSYPGGSIGSRYPVYSFNNYSVGDVLCYFRKADVVGVGGMTERTWNWLMRGANTDYAWTVGPYLVMCRYRGYIVESDGIAYNEDLKAEYGPDVIVMEIANFIGGAGVTTLSGLTNNIITVHPYAA